MQTFLPYADFELSARSLDYKRLGKQRTEAALLVQINSNLSKKLGWKNHPASRMWSPFVEALKEYTNIMITEWIRRGFKNNMLIYEIKYPIIYPTWLGNEDFHRSHRLMLAHKSIKKYFDTGKRETLDWYTSRGFINEYIKFSERFNGYVWPVDLKTINKVVPFHRSELRKVALRIFQGEYMDDGPRSLRKEVITIT